MGLSHHLQGGSKSRIRRSGRWHGDDFITRSEFDARHMALLHLVRAEWSTFRSELVQLRGEMRARFGQLHTEREGRKSHVDTQLADLKTDVKELKADVGQLKVDVQGLRGEMEGIKSSLTTVQWGVALIVALGVGQYLPAARGLLPGASPERVQAQALAGPSMALAPAGASASAPEETHGARPAGAEFRSRPAADTRHDTSGE